MRRSERCCTTIMPTTATSRPAASLGAGRLSCTASPGVASAAISLWSNTAMPVATGVTTWPDNTTCRFVSLFRWTRFAAVSEAFLEAVAPAEMEAWERARTAQSNARNAMEKAAAQQLERLRYQAALAERQYNRVDPDNRLVASELERRWEAALRELRDAERALAERRAANDQEIAPNVVELRTTFADAARRLSTLWRDARLTPARRKALLRCLIDKVVLRRKSAHEVALRIVWRGGETSNIDVDTGASVMHSLSVLKNLQLRVIELARQGLADREIADLLTAEGLRSPSCGHVLPATVERIRHQHGIRRRPEHHCPRRLIPGHLTVTQLAERLKVPRTGSTRGFTTEKSPSYVARTKLPTSSQTRRRL